MGEGGLRLAVAAATTAWRHRRVLGGRLTHPGISWRSVACSIHVLMVASVFAEVKTRK